MLFLCLVLVLFYIKYQIAIIRKNFLFKYCYFYCYLFKQIILPFICQAILVYNNHHNKNKNKYSCLFVVSSSSNMHACSCYSYSCYLYEYIYSFFINKCSKNSTTSTQTRFVFFGSFLLISIGNFSKMISNLNSLFKSIVHYLLVIYCVHFMTSQPVECFSKRKYMNLNS